VKYVLWRESFQRGSARRAAGCGIVTGGAILPIESGTVGSGGVKRERREEEKTGRARKHEVQLRV